MQRWSLDVVALWEAFYIENKRFDLDTLRVPSRPPTPISKSNDFLCTKTGSSTQRIIMLSSAEAELVAAVMASTEWIGGAIQMEKAWGHEVGGEVYVDSSAALALVGREGNGKLRHVKVGCLWI